MPGALPVRALEYSGAGSVRFVDVSADLAGALPPGHAPVRARWSGISRGTERLVFEGRVPVSEHERMRAPFQRGDFPGPVRYGYMTVGEVLEGPLAGREVFCLHPHQEEFVAPEGALTPLPPGLPGRRAVLAANMETALNAVWDARVGPGDRVVVVGAGVVGSLIAYLAARVVGTDVTLVDVDERRRPLASDLGVDFASDCPGGGGDPVDVVLHASASASGLAAALGCAGPEARVVEVSWYGAGDVPAPLGAAFHSQRLRLVSSQVGRLPPERAPRWSHARRLGKALELLRDPALDALLSGESRFEDAPADLPDVLRSPSTLCHVLHYEE